MTTTHNHRIIGAIIGDVVGSTYEFVDKIPAKFKLFRNVCSFTDDTVLTVAIADALLHNTSPLSSTARLWKPLWASPPRKVCLWALVAAPSTPLLSNTSAPTPV